MTLTRWQHALLSFILSLCVIVSLWVITVIPLQTYYASRVEQLDKTQSKLLRFKDLAIENQSLKAQLAKAKSMKPARNYFMRAQSVSLAAAQLQDKVKSLVTAKNGELISTQVVPSKPTDHLTPVSIRVSVRVDIIGLQGILYQLESARPLSYLTAMRIQYRGVTKRHKEDMSNAPIILNVQFTLTAYMLNQGATKG